MMTNNDYLIITNYIKTAILSMNERPCSKLDLTLEVNVKVTTVKSFLKVNEDI